MTVTVTVTMTMTLGTTMTMTLSMTMSMTLTLIPPDHDDVHARDSELRPMKRDERNEALDEATGGIIRNPECPEGEWDGTYACAGDHDWIDLADSYPCKALGRKPMIAAE